MTTQRMRIFSRRLKMRFHFAALMLLTLLSTPAGAQVTLKADPVKDSLMAGMKVFVDDGSCPAGQIKEITAANPKAGIMKRTSECVGADIAAKSDPLQEYRLGGKFSAFDPVVSEYNQSGKLFRISGHCQSACTVFLAIKNVCIEPGAELLFHAGGQERVSAEATNHMLSAYSPSLRVYLLERHAMDTLTFFPISGADLIQKFGYRECPPLETQRDPGKGDSQPPRP
jgi:hypothetical protein